MKFSLTPLDADIRLEVRTQPWVGSTIDIPHGQMHCTWTHGEWEAKRMFSGSALEPETVRLAIAHDNPWARFAIRVLVTGVNFSNSYTIDPGTHRSVPLDKDATISLRPIDIKAVEVAA